MRWVFNSGKQKVAIIGAGYVGSSIAYALTLRNIAREIVLIDLDKQKAMGETLDIRHGIAGFGDVELYAGDYSDCADCDLIIITAGRNRRSGESRLDLAGENAKALHGLINCIKPYYTRGVILVISNPVDVLTQKVHEWMDLPNGMVFGSGCILDSSRFVTSIADYTKVCTGVVNGYLVGEHGDSQIPVWSRVTIGGIPIFDFCRETGLPWNDEVRAEIERKTRTMGAQIISTKGRTHFGVATCVCHLADAILNQKQTIVSVSSPLKGEHGVSGVSLSVPSIVGAMGVQQRIRERWGETEYRAFFASVEKVRRTLSSICE